MTIFGWDASHYDWSRGSMDIAAAVRDGITFFTHKATEGTSMKDAYLGQAMNRAKDAGVRFLGAYHVVRSSSSASAQADFMLNYLNSAAPWWKTFDGFFLQADVEVWPDDKVAATQGEAFADAVESKSGHKCVVYASKGQYGDQFAGTSHELWNANYGNNAKDRYRTIYAQRGGDKGAGWTTYSGKMPKIWQFGSQTIIGSQSTCDANAFQGTVADFATMIGASSMASSDFTAPCTGSLNRGNTRDDILADAGNVRDWLYGKPGDPASSKNPPPAGSRLDVIMQAAQKVMGTTGSTTITAADIEAIANAVMAKLGAATFTTKME